jgi:rifampin ADP-ribosyltransferase
MAPEDDVSSQVLYHGTRADLKPGDLIAPGYRSNFGTRKTAGYVYLTSILETAAWGAELAVGEGPGRIYTVEPTGPFMADPNLTHDGVNPTESYRTLDPLRVTGECTEWEGHSPEVIATMRERIEGLDPLPGS